MRRLLILFLFGLSAWAASPFGYLDIAPQYVFVGFNKGASGGTSHTFTYVSRGTGCSTTSSTSAITCTPTTGNFVQIIAAAFNNGSTPSCSISGMNVTPHSPAYDLSATESVCIGYVFSASAGSQTFTVTWTNATAVSTIGHEFSCSPACSSVTLDADAAANTTLSNLPVNTPNAVAASSGELLTSGAYTSDGAVACGNTWTLSGPATDGNISCYILSGASGTTAVKICEQSGCTDTGQDSWASMAATWK